LPELKGETVRFVIGHWKMGSSYPDGQVGLSPITKSGFHRLFGGEMKVILGLIIFEPEEKPIKGLSARHAAAVGEGGPEGPSM
jgi:hypothetical protein